MKEFFVSDEGMSFTELVDLINKKQGVDVSAVRISVGAGLKFH